MKLIVTLIIIILGILFLYGEDTRTKRKTYIVICGFLLIVQAGFRHLDLIDTESSNDTIRYFYSYNSLIDVPMTSLLKNFSLFDNGYADRDPGYNIFVKLTQIFSTNFRIFLIIVATIITIPLCRIIYRFTPTRTGYILAFVVYQALFAGFFETGIRQTVAMGILFMGLGYVINKKTWKFLFILVIAYTIHATALVFLPILLYRYIKSTKKILLLTLFVTPFLMVFISDILISVASDSNYSQYVVDTEHNMGTPVFSMLLIGVATSTLLFSADIKKQTPYFKLFSFAVSFAVFLMPLTWVDSNFMRLTFYYTIFLMPLIPIILNSVTLQIPQLSFLAYIITIVILLIITKT